MRTNHDNEGPSPGAAPAETVPGRDIAEAGATGEQGARNVAGRPSRILVVDDEPSLRRLLSYQLGTLGYVVDTVETGEAALDAIAAGTPDLVLLDLMLPGIDGLEVLRRLRRVRPDLPVVLLTAYGSVENAVEAMKLGAQDFLTKPFEMERLRIAVRNGLSIGQLSREVATLRHELGVRYRFDEIIGAYGGLAGAVALTEKVIPTDLTVLLQGESGTGKELFARAIHHQGPRRNGPFVAINCAALPETLLENELFGHEKGAFTGAHAARPGTFEAADGGTLFLDEIAETSRPLQAKLLRVLQDRTVTRIGGTTPIPVDVRIVSASNHDLGSQVAMGAFREDLFYRLSVFPITLPPLRERREDIPALVWHVLSDGARREPTPITPAAMALLEAHDWPGNVRELHNVVRRAIVLAGDQAIVPDHLPPDIALGRNATRAGSRGFIGMRPPAHGDAVLHDASGTGAASDDVPQPLEDIERAHILRAVEHCGGNLSRVARVLRIGRTTLYRKLQSYGVTPTAVS